MSLTDQLTTHGFKPQEAPTQQVPVSMDNSVMKIEDYVKQLEAHVEKLEAKRRDLFNANVRLRRKLEKEQQWNAKARRMLSTFCYNVKIYTPIFEGARDIARTLKGKNRLF